MSSKKTSEYLVFTGFQYSLSQYGQVNPLFFFFNSLLDRLKNSIPQLLHLYFLGFRIEYFPPQLYIFKQIHITKSFPIFGGYLIWI